MSDAHENFCSLIGSQLVVPRRNIYRGMSRVEAGTPADLAEATHYLCEAYDGIRQVEQRIADEETRTIHRCSCGHTHYRHGEDA